MSDDESFVILGTSPMPSICNSPPESINSFDSLQQSHIKNEIKSAVDDLASVPPGKITDDIITEPTKSVVASIENTKSRSLEASLENAKSKSLEASIENTKSKSLEASIKNTKSESIDTSIESLNFKTEIEIKAKEKSKNFEERTNRNGEQSILQTSSLANSSMAASFILGELDADVLKTSVYSQFPSLCSMEACAEDVVKLQNMMAEYIELKHTLSKVSATMKLYYNKTMMWKEQMERTETEYKQLLEECRKQIAALRNENLELKAEINTKLADITLCDEIRQKDHEKLIVSLSEKKSIIDNMRTQIDKLEQHQLASFEFVPKTLSDAQNKPEYVDRLEHERIIKELERKMSQMLAENLDLNDMKSTYVDEINCLKVNLTAAEELIKKAQADIEILRSNDAQKDNTFARYDTERKNLQEEVTLLREQVEIYSKDFTVETTLRKHLAKEKDELLNDLRSLQRRNQELIVTAQKHVEEFERLSNTATRGAQALDPSTAQVTCPLCFKGFQTLSKLYTHVNDCLDNRK